MTWTALTPKSAYGWVSKNLSGGGPAEDTAGASAVWFFDEGSGDIVDEIAGVTLVPIAGETYSVAAPSGFEGYGVGIDCPISGGFHKTTAASSMNIGTGDQNLVVIFKISNPVDTGTARFLEVTASGSGSVGWGFVWNNAASNKAIGFYMYSGAGDTDSGSWNTAAITTAYNDGAGHKLEFQFNRTANTVECFLDNASQGTISIANNNGKNITGVGVGVGSDYRNGIPGVQGCTFYFVRQKLSLT